MPGGNPTIKTELLDLESFLERKRKPIDVWLIQNNITSEQALQDLIQSSKWKISDKLIETIRSFFVVEKQPEKVVEVSLKEETLPLPIFALAEEPAKEVEEIQSQVIEINSTEETVSNVEEEEEVVETRIANQNWKGKRNR